MTRTVTVAIPGDLAVTLRIGDGGSYLEIDEDGTPIAGTSGGIAADGDTVRATGATEIRVLAGNAGAVSISVNGLGIGTMGGPGAVIEWRIRPVDP
jgi:hypothetical protein